MSNQIAKNRYTFVLAGGLVGAVWYKLCPTGKLLCNRYCKQELYTMIRDSKILCLVLLTWLCSRSPAMEGDFIGEKKQILETGTWYFDYAGQKSVKEIVAAYNNIETIKNHIKIGIDSKLAAMSVTDFKVGAVPV